MIAPINGDSGQPSVTADNGRKSNGQFAPGNRAAKGNPHFKQMALLRGRLLKKMTDEEMDAVAETLISQAKAGDIQSIKELFAYVLGKPYSSDQVIGSESESEQTMAVPRDVLIEMLRNAGQRKQPGAT